MGKKKKQTNKVTLKPLEDPTTFVPPLPIGLPHMGRPPHVPWIQAKDHPYMLLSHFYPKIKYPPLVDEGYPCPFQ